MTDDPISRIEAALEAGPGPWEYREVEDMGAITHPHGWVEAVNSAGQQECTDARFIAACNPVAIRTLLDRLKAAEAENERLRKSLAAMQGHVLEMCRVFNVPLPEDSLNDARAALENTDAR